MPVKSNNTSVPMIPTHGNNSNKSESKETVFLYAQDILKSTYFFKGQYTLARGSQSHVNLYLNTMEQKMLFY